uniref:Uncharacterized protein n=1 Tax=Pelusios castaneus TaxID=367368 RepID=A0A8C8S567_9SAUR
ETFFFQPEYTWQRFYLFNELKISHDERDAIEAPVFVFTKHRLGEKNSLKRKIYC